jgi:predicted ribosome quality control (RQC) complex YloA/Tae2 family protein
MSLNHKEIDLILSELDLEAAHIQRILQPTFDSLVLGLYKSGRETEILISIAHGACRIHSLRHVPPKPERALRFQECLKSRIRGGKIVAIRQLGAERIVRIDIAVARIEDADEVVYKPLGVFAQDQAYGNSVSAKAKSEDGPPPSGRPEGLSEGTVLKNYILYARLWSGAGNLILVDEEGLIVDVMARRPKKGEISGEPCRIEEELAQTSRPSTREFAVRDLPPVPPLPPPRERPADPDKPPRVERRPGPEGGSFNERVEAAYAEHGGELSRDRLIEAARERFEKRRRALDIRIAELEKRAGELGDGDRLRELGDILMANQGAQAPGRFLDCEDFYRGGTVAVELEPRLSVLENAKRYYERYKKASSSLVEVEAELAATRASLAQEVAELARLEACKEALLIAKALAKGGTVRTKHKRPYPGLSLEHQGWTILVGRTAKENDELLRHHVRGSDLWMHARDYAGSYVFIKAKAGKSFPLDIMIDAGNLAIYYSKGRANGGGELYYTLAKHLRRAKDGPKGLVLPSQEKNLHVNLDEARLRELKAEIGED